MLEQVYRLQKRRKFRPTLRVIGPSIAYVDLDHGSFALIDSDNSDWSEQFTWHLGECDGKHYASTTFPRNQSPRRRYMHRLIAGSSDQIDHSNANSLDNRTCNLRLSTQTQNLHNTRLRRDNKSGLKGVKYNLKSKRWYSRIQTENGRVSLGGYATKEEAHAAYLAAAKHYFGDFARSE